MSTRMTLGTKPNNINTHDLIKTGDPEICDDAPFPGYCDSNGEVVLAFCRRCHGGEVELFEQSCIERLVQQAAAAEAKLPPLQRAINQLKQKRSWVVGESMMNDDASPNGRTREECMAMMEKIAPEFVLLAEFERRNVEEHVASDGTTRKTHYGASRQPWDDIKEAGWGPEFCAGNVLKYLRRDKDLKHSLESAQVYYSWLKNLAFDSTLSASEQGNAISVMSQLNDILTTDEHVRLH